ncbi:MAG: hypothetical protein HY462_01770, partial [Parcubacteria group bacterium]|nr:hypothetical protein [Parcubacteria group bacterium]
MKIKKMLYGLLIALGVLVAAVVVITLTVPPPSPEGEKQANAECVPSSLSGVPLVNGLGKDISIPLFPGASRFSFPETGASQYIAKAFDSDILSFYQDRMRSLCWEAKEEASNEVVYKNNGNQVRLALLPNPAGRTVIDFAVLASDGVLGRVKIADTYTSCSNEQFWCNGACVAMGTSCPSPTSAADCQGGSNYCAGSSGGTGWCQSSACSTSGTTGSTGSTWPTDQASCTSQSKFWCTSSSSSGWCQSTSCPASDYPYTSGNNNASCSADQYPCNGACVPVGTSCTSQAWPTDQASCTSQSKFWCTGSGGGGGGWCQSTSCSTNYSTTTCQNGQWWCNGGCISTSSQCNGYYYNGTTSSTQTGTTQTNTTNTQTNQQTTVPTGTTCASGYTWCSYENGCIASGRPCYPSTPQANTQQQTQQQNQQQQQTQTQQQGQQENQRGSGDQYRGQEGQWGGPSEEEMQRMKEEQFKQMKRGVDQFVRGMTQMKRFVDRAKARLSRQGVGIPPELENALAKAPELVAKLKAAKDIEEFEELMGDMQDIGMIMQEWGPRMGDLDRLAGMLSQADRDLRNMSRAFTRTKNLPKR